MNMAALSIGGGLLITVGAWRELDISDEQAVRLIYSDTHVRVLTPEQSDVFLRSIGVKESPIAAPPARFDPRDVRRGR